MSAELVDMVSWDTALARTTSRPETKAIITEAIETIRHYDDGSTQGIVEVKPPASGGSVVVTLSWLHAINPSPSRLAVIVLTPGYAAEVYDVPPRVHSRLPLWRLTARANNLAKGWW